MPAQKRWLAPPHPRPYAAEDLFAEIGAAEVVKGVVAPPTPGTDTWWRAVAAVNTVYVMRERGLAQYMWEAEVVNWTGPPSRQTRPLQNRQLRRMALISAFFSSSLSRDAEEWRLAFTQRRMK
jgi:hypothetical protein